VKYFHFPQHRFIAYTCCFKSHRHAKTMFYIGIRLFNHVQCTELISSNAEWQQVWSANHALHNSANRAADMQTCPKCFQV